VLRVAGGPRSTMDRGRLSGWVASGFPGQFRSCATGAVAARDCAQHTYAYGLRAALRRCCATGPLAGCQ